MIFYSQGYRIDLGSKKIAQTGGLFLKVMPKQVEIYLDGKLIKKTDFFFGSSLIENLLPNKYKIKVVKKGYSSWEKTLEVKEKEVTEIKNIILFPENLDFEILSKNVEDFWPSPDGKKLILKEIEENSWSLKLYDSGKKVKSHLINEKDISSKGAFLLDLNFSSDSKEISLEVGVDEKVKILNIPHLKYFSLNFGEIPPILTEIKAPSALLENVVTYQKLNNDIYYLNNFGYLFKNEEKLTEKSFPVKKESEYRLEIFQNFIFLEEDRSLYQFNPNLKSFEKFFEGFNSLRISPESKKLTYFSDYEIWILFLEEKKGQSQKKAGEKLFLIRLSEKISDVFWLNSDYLVFNTGDKIKISEIDGRDKINVVDITELKNPEIFWNKIDKKLYILSEENLYKSDKLIK